MRAAWKPVIVVLLCVALALPPSAGEESGDSARREPPAEPERRFHWWARIHAESVSNLHGGIRPGTAYDSLVHLGLSVDSSRIGLWKGGRFHATLLQIASGDPSARYIGDVQVVSNVEAPSATRVGQLWYRQRVAAIGVQAGLIDLNQYFVVTDSADLLANSSFGIIPTISANVPSSIYPKPGFGLMMDGGRGVWTGRFGIFQGDPGRRNSVFREGAMLIGELERGREAAADTGFKIGLWRHGGGSTADTTGGAYAILEKGFERAGAGEAVLFLQLGANPGTEDPVRGYLGLGASIPGPLPGRRDDRLALGLARAWLPGAAETSYGASWSFALGPHVALQPDLQYVSHPSGSLPDALVAIFRVRLAVSPRRGADESGASNGSGRR